MVIPEFFQNIKKVLFQRIVSIQNLRLRDAIIADNKTNGEKFLCASSNANITPQI